MIQIQIELVFRFFRIFGWICGSSAAISPLDTALQNLEVVTKSNKESAKCRFNDFDGFKPEDKRSSKEQYEITFKRPFTELE